MTVTVKGYTTITGNPVAILKIMQEARFFDKKEDDAYIDQIKRDAQRFYGIELHAEGQTYSERAENLLRELEKHNLISIEE